MSFDPRYKNSLLDFLISSRGLKNDAALSRALEVDPPIISKIRNGHAEISDGMILRVHEKLGVAVADIRALIASGSGQK